MWSFAKIGYYDGNLFALLLAEFERRAEECPPLAYRQVLYSCAQTAHPLSVSSSAMLVTSLSSKLAQDEFNGKDLANITYSMSHLRLPDSEALMLSIITASTKMISGFDNPQHTALLVLLLHSISKVPHFKLKAYQLPIVILIHEQTFAMFSDAGDVGVL